MIYICSAPATETYLPIVLQSAVMHGVWRNLVRARAHTTEKWQQRRRRRWRRRRWNIVAELAKIVSKKIARMAIGDEWITTRWKRMRHSSRKSTWGISHLQFPAFINSAEFKLLLFRILSDWVYYSEWIVVLSTRRWIHFQQKAPFCMNNWTCTLNPWLY